MGGCQCSSEEMKEPEITDIINIKSKNEKKVNPAHRQLFFESQLEKFIEIDPKRKKIEKSNQSSPLINFPRISQNDEHNREYYFLSPNKYPTDYVKFKKEKDRRKKFGIRRNNQFDECGQEEENLEPEMVEKRNGLKFKEMDHGVMGKEIELKGESIGVANEELKLGVRHYRFDQFFRYKRKFQF